MTDKKAIVIGVGPEAGLGARLAQRFASLGLHVFVAGRTQADLDRVAASITTNHGKATAIVTDATDEAAVTKTATVDADDDEGDSPAEAVRDWNIPSWNDLIASLNRPER